MLRHWQSQSVDAALSKYSDGQRHFLCLATPGAGKTVMAAEVAKRLLDNQMVDLVICFSPSTAVAAGIQSTFSWKLECSFNGGIGSIGGSYTYQNMLYLKDCFWSLLNRYRVLVVFDEIHHCAGSSLEDANAWGAKILTKVQQHAAYTLALTGTPWRSDKTPIVLTSYTDEGGEILCDYVYGLGEAIRDSVCRLPKIVLVDSDRLTLSESGEKKLFESFSDLLRNSSTPYLSVISHHVAMKYVLGLGCNKLSQIRCHNSEAGGLIVAASVEHARQIQQMLIQDFNQTAVIVTYRDDEPLRKIDNYRHSSTQWIVSVGMISEGTDIPRLQVCCHLSSIKTELYFRQVLGRIMRITDSPNQDAWLYTLADEQLTGFAERINEDLPEGYSILDTSEELEMNIKGNVFIQSQPVKTNGGSLSVSEISDELCINDLINSDKGSALQLQVERFRERVVEAFVMVEIN
ncbi:DEAD/DEAH box helicase family protein [uncultured Photobacterium sp.]|uniref:DEAD/DEAH box helicase n=1 Tax=uncultured Photobacterium sp. TaxID=173973 RepID=UPI0026324DD1|nr:DEAD/DEAH box helicase family protein [uncultured Photobacterium sp.]